jgi:hypothetical protein
MTPDWITKINVTLISLLIILCISCNSQTIVKTTNGHYETARPSFAFAKIYLKDGKFKMKTYSDAGQGKGNGHYKINWSDSTITFDFKNAKARSNGHLHKKNKSKDSMTFKINNTSVFSFGGFSKKD